MKTIARLASLAIADQNKHQEDKMSREEFIAECKKGRKNFSSQNLRSLCYGGDLTEANLAGANLAGANLAGVDLTKANLTEANLTKANLTGVDLTEANLAGANLAGANLTGANLAGANLTGANLQGVIGLSSKEEEMRFLQAIQQEIVDKGMLDMKSWHFIRGECFDSLKGIKAEDLSHCGTTHCAAGSAQLLAVKSGRVELASLEASVVGSMLIPSAAFCFHASNEQFIEILDSFISGERPLIYR